MNILFLKQTCYCRMSWVSEGNWNLQVASASTQQSNKETCTLEETFQGTKDSPVLLSLVYAQTLWLCCRPSCPFPQKPPFYQVQSLPSVSLLTCACCVRLLVGATEEQYVHHPQSTSPRWKGQTEHGFCGDCSLGIAPTDFARVILLIPLTPSKNRFSYSILGLG